MDIAFSGMLYKIEKDAGMYCPADICFTVQEMTFSMLVEVTERAMSATQSTGVIIVGGVACMLMSYFRQRTLTNSDGENVRRKGGDAWNHGRTILHRQWCDDSIYRHACISIRQCQCDYK